jgi:hypothetical protein
MPFVLFRRSLPFPPFMLYLDSRLLATFYTLSFIDYIYPTSHPPTHATHAPHLHQPTQRTIYIYIYMYVYIYIYIYIYIYTYICIHIYIYVCAWGVDTLCSSRPSPPPTHQIQVCMYVCMYVCVCMYTHTHARTRTHTHTNTHTPSAVWYPIALGTRFFWPYTPMHSSGRVIVFRQTFRKNTSSPRVTVWSLYVCVCVRVCLCV